MTAPISSGRPSLNQRAGTMRMPRATSPSISTSDGPAPSSVVITAQMATAMIAMPATNSSSRPASACCSGMMLRNTFTIGPITIVPAMQAQPRRAPSNQPAR